MVFAKCLERSQDLAKSQQTKGDTIAQSSRTPIEPSFPAHSAVRKPSHSPPRKQLEDLSIKTSSGPTVLIVDDNRLNIRVCCFCKGSRHAPLNFVHLASRSLHQKNEDRYVQGYERSRSCRSLQTSKRLSTSCFNGYACLPTQHNVSINLT